MKTVKKLSAILLAAVLALSAAACGGPDDPATTAPAGTETTTKAPSTEAPQPSASAPEASSAAPTEAPTEATTEPHEETPEEFQAALVSFLNMELLNGFLHTDFDDPRDALLGEAVKQGNDKDSSVDYVKAYAENGREYLEGAGIRAVSEEHMNEFLQTVAGITPADMRTNAEAIYLKGYNAYTVQAGDSNYQAMEIVRIGTDPDGNTVITYKASEIFGDWIIWYLDRNNEWQIESAPVMQLTLGRSGDGGFRVLKNHSPKLAARLFMESSPVNGFLMSAYADARDARLYEVLYQYKEKDADAAAIMKKHGKTPEEGIGFRSITMDTLSEWTRKVTGCDAGELFETAYRHAAFSDMTAVNRVWFPEERIFIIQAGDTNFRTLRIQEFSMDDDGICTIVYGDPAGYGWHFYFSNDPGMNNLYEAKSMVCRMKLDENGDFRILSNRPHVMTRISVEEAEINVFFNRFRLTNGLIHSAFTDVRNADFGGMVNQGYDDVDYETVKKAFASQGRTPDPATGFSAVLDEEMDDFLYGVTGYHLSEFADRGSSLHFDGFGFYGMEHGDSDYQPAVIDEVILGDDGSIAVYYHSQWGAWRYAKLGADGKTQYFSAKQMLAVLERTDDYWYHIISNEPVGQ